MVQARSTLVWTECPYVERDGQFNPDRLLVNDTGSFGAMADAVFYNAIAWALTNTSTYATKAANYIDTWFINPDTYMTPNLNFAQMHRGPDGQVGSSTGLMCVCHPEACFFMPHGPMKVI
jgi:hypothetical protein